MADTTKSIIKIIELRNNDEISLSVARPFIAAIIEDANETEEIIFPQNICGFCLKNYGRLYCDRLNEVPMKKVRKMRKKYQYIGENLCESCFDSIVTAEFGIAVANSTKREQYP